MVQLTMNFFCILLFASNLAVRPFSPPGMLEDVVDLAHWLPNKVKSMSSNFNYVGYYERYHVYLLVIASSFVEDVG